jgi:energy-coupling factor transport system permease protein
VLYLDRPTSLHRLHPQAKGAALLLFFACALVFSHPLWLLLPAVCLLAVVFGWRLQGAYRRVIVLIGVLFLATILMWALVLGGGEPLVALGPLAVSREGLLFGVGMGMRICLMIAAGVVYLATTRPEETVWALQRTGVPYRAAFSLGLVFRLLPLFLDQARRIREAQIARGLDLGARNPLERARAHLPLVAPVILSALRRVDRMAVALEGRGFGGSVRRTSMWEPRFGLPEMLALAAAGGLLAVEILVRLAGHGALEAGRLAMGG